MIGLEDVPHHGSAEPGGCLRYREAVGLSPKDGRHDSQHPLPELMDPSNLNQCFHLVANDQVRRLVGTVKNVASRDCSTRLRATMRPSMNARLACYVQEYRYRHHAGVRKVCLCDRSSATEPIL